MDMKKLLGSKCYVGSDTPFCKQNQLKDRLA
jgi:hypothetical protein